MEKCFLTLDSAVAEIEGMVKAINSNNGCFFDARRNFTGLQFDYRDLKLFVATFSKFMPVYEISEIVSYVNKKGSEVPLIIAELNIEKYLPSIQKIRHIEEAKRLKSTLNDDYQKLQSACNYALDNLRITALQATDDLAIIESIIKDCDPYTKVYELATKKAIEIYKTDLAKVPSSTQANRYLDKIKDRHINLSKSEHGFAFKSYCARLIEHLLLTELQFVTVETNSLGQISRLNKLARKYDIDSVSKSCEESMHILIKQIIRTADDATFENLYPYCPENAAKQFLSKWMYVTEDNSLNNLLIYRDFALSLPKNRFETKKAMKKVIKLFESASKADNSFAQLLKIMQHISKIEIDHSRILEYMFDLNIQIQTIVIKIIESVTELDLDDACAISRAANCNKPINEALAKSYLWLHPNTATINRLGKFPFNFDLDYLINLDDEVNTSIKSIFEHETIAATSNDELRLLYERVNCDSSHPTTTYIQQLLAEKTYCIKHETNL